AITGALVFSAAADAVHALGQVDRLEVGRERTDEIAGVLQVGARGRSGQCLDQLDNRRVAFAAADRGTAQAFDLGEKGRAALLGEDLADQCAEGFYILAQQRIGGAELDGAQGFVPGVRQIRHAAYGNAGPVWTRATAPSTRTP